MIKGENKHGLDLSLFDGDISGKNIEKYRFFNIKEGVMLPTLKGFENKRFTIEDIIDISSFMIKNMKIKRKLSFSMLSHIIETYQSEFGAPQLDLIKGIQLSGYILFKDY